MGVFATAIGGLREAVLQSKNIVTSAKGYSAVQAARTSVSAASSAASRTGEKAAVNVGIALGKGSRSLAYALRSDFITSLVALEVFDVIERKLAKRATKKQIRDLTEYLARTSPLKSKEAQKEREKDIKHLLHLEESLPKRRTFRKFLSDLPKRIMRRVYRAAKTSVGTTGAVVTAPLALATFAIDLLWRVVVLVPVSAVKQMRGEEFDSNRYTKYTGALLSLGIKPFFFFLKITVDGMAMRTWMESSDVAVMEDLEKTFEVVEVCSDEQAEAAFANGYEDVSTIRFEHGGHKASVYAMSVRCLWEQNKDHEYLSAYYNGAREATPWIFKDLVTS